MTSSMDCANCGARATMRDARFCSFCGHEMPRAVVESAAPPPSDPETRFRRLRAHPDLASSLAFVPSAAATRLEAVPIVLFAVAFFSVGAIMIVPAMMFPPVLIPLVAILALGVFVVGKSLGRTWKISRGELVRLPALVVDERTAVSGGGDSSVRTQYYVSLESERGTREEYEVDPRVASKVAPGDMGVAYFKGGFLVDFRRIAV